VFILENVASHKHKCERLPMFKPLNEIIEELVKCIELDFLTGQQAKVFTETTNGLMNTKLPLLPEGKNG